MPAFRFRVKGDIFKAKLFENDRVKITVIFVTVLSSKKIQTDGVLGYSRYSTL